MQANQGAQWRRRKRILIRLGVLALLLVLGLWAVHAWFGGKAKDRAQASIPVQATTVSRQDVPVYIEGLGTVQAYNTVTVRPQVDGQLVKVLFREGQDVRAGALLAQIDPRTFQAQLEQAQAAKAKDEATLANARRDLERYQSLGDAIARQTVDTQVATVRQLEATTQADQAAISNAQTQLSFTAIASPIAGRTGIRQVDVGNIVHPGDANGIVVVTQLQPISVVFSLPQQQVLPVNQAMAQGGRLKAVAIAPDRSVIDEGVLELVDNEIDQGTGTVRLKATFPNDQHLLWPGGFVNIRLLLATREGALTVPAPAVQLGPKGNYVFVVKEDETVELRPVTPSLTEGQMTVIDQGVQEGERVVTDGMAKLKEGSKVTLATGEQTAAPTPSNEKPARYKRKPE